MYLHKFRMEVGVYICRKLSLKIPNMTYLIQHTQRPATFHKKSLCMGAVTPQLKHKL